MRNRSHTATPAVRAPAYVITMTQDRCDALRAHAALVMPKLRCVLATRRDDITYNNATGVATVRACERDTRCLSPSARVLVRVPPVHPDVFEMRALEVAILLSHLRAVAAGHASGAPHFLVLEEDVELALLLSRPALHLQRQLDALPSRWHVLQLSVIAEMPWLKHLRRRLERARQPMPFVRRDSLFGLSWPFTSGRTVSKNASWVKPYWSAACYAVSRAGASHVLSTYWSGAPELAGATIDTRSQLWAPADQLLFNSSRTYVGAPLLTQAVEGAHAEHAKYKRVSRDFVLAAWFPPWAPVAAAAAMPLRELPFAVYAIATTPSASEGSGCAQRRREWRAALPAHVLLEPRAAVEEHALELASARAEKNAPRFALLIHEGARLGTDGGTIAAWAALAMRVPDAVDVVLLDARSAAGCTPTHPAATNQSILPPRLAADSICCAAARPERCCIDAAYAALVRVASLRRILDSVVRRRGRWTGGCVQPGHALLALASDGVAVHGVPSGRHATRCEG